jgi:hypothetical protein
LGKTAFFGEGVDLNLLTQTLDGHGYTRATMRDLGNSELVVIAEREWKSQPPLWEEGGLY